ncbi:YwlC protein [Gymnopilus junonius]|uniref:Threonylcarbamoyl-AMP synthase n=1 Tax=Gymnopilus junonius TaxID=109634 RepID=A0A9P5TTP6_GYMJU|nr:YwlC protein [Gymnopilus junonius]
MLSERATLYRRLLRELRQSLNLERKVNREIMARFRSIAETVGKEGQVNARQDIENAVLFFRSQREHKQLLERYNPLFDLTAEERIKATARRVGLDMPPQIASNATSEALKIASHQLVDLEQTVVFPTETVYGLGALALNATAAAKIFSTKGRPPDNPLIVHVSSFHMLRSLLPPEYVIPKVYEALMKHFWPGALTLLFPRNENIPFIITAGQPTVAIRMPSHPVARALIATANVPLAAPSANTSGKPSPTRAEHVYRDLHGKVGLILDGGACGVGLESTVVDALHADGHVRVLRPGGITVEDLEKALSVEMNDTMSIPKVLVHKRDYADEKIENAPTTPGMKYRHYSPSVPVTLLLTLPESSGTIPSTDLSSYVSSLRRETTVEGELKVGVLAPTDSKLWGQLQPIDGVTWSRFPLGPLAEPSLIAHTLFDGLLSLEKDGVHLILIEEVEEDREGLAIMNRVRKAASHSIRIPMD